MPGPRPRWLRLSEWLLALGAIALTTGVWELGLRVVGVPEPIISGWHGDPGLTPRHALGGRGRVITYTPDDFVVVLLGDSQVECALCPADETMDAILETALRHFIPHARVVSLGAGGYGQDQEFLALQAYFARHRADLVVNWLTTGNDVWNNIFRTAGTAPARGPPKPSFWLEDQTLHGPTEPIGAPVHATRLQDLVHLRLGDFEADWARHLPPADPGTAAPAAGLPAREEIWEDITNQRTHWVMWLDPPPARVQYGIALTRALWAGMRDLARTHGAGFMILAPDEYSPTMRAQATRLGLRFFVQGAEAVGQAGHWYVAREARYHANLAALTAGFETVAPPITTAEPRVSADDLHLNMAANREIMATLAAYVGARR